VRISPVNPRLQNAQTDDDLAELEAMIAAVGQHNPVTVRRLVGDPEHDFELIAGSRRHLVISRRRAAGSTDLLKAIAIDCDDVEAARIADAENRGREPISAYERALFLRHQLTHYGSQSALAAAMMIERALLNRLLLLAEWPDWLLVAWPDPRDISAYDAGVVGPRLRNAALRDKLRDAAARIADEQQRLRAEKQPLLTPTEVRRRLLDATSSKPSHRMLRRPNGDVAVVVRSQTREGMLLYVKVGDEVLQRRIIDSLHVSVNQALHERSCGRL
jgi:ParB family chromosome partitioning protein